MIDVQFDQASKNRVKALLKKMDAEKADNAVRSGVLDVTTFMQKVLAANVSGIVLRVRTGNLYRSLGLRIEKIDGVWTGITGSGAKVADPTIAQGGIDYQSDANVRMVYADILENGGVIRPVNRKYLTIPMGAALTPSGVQRFSAPEARQYYDKTVVIFPFIFGIKPGGKKDLLFKLVSSVTIPPKRYLARSVEDAGDSVGEVMVTAVERELSR